MGDPFVLSPAGIALESVSIGGWIVSGSWKMSNTEKLRKLPEAYENFNLEKCALGSRLAQKVQEEKK